MDSKKQLPSNLKQLEQKPRFKQFYKQHTSEQLEEKLIEAGVEYGNDDNKAALTWRLMDAKGMDFDNQANDKPADDKIEPTKETDDNADATVSTPPPPKTDDSNAGNDNDDSEQPSAGTEQAAAPSVNDNSVTNQPTKETDDNVETNPPVSTNIDSAPTSNGSKENQPTAANEAGKPADYIAVTNTGAYNFYETATGTMVKAKATTKIYATPTIGMAQILRNIEQYNHTRGNKLYIKK